MKPSTKACVFIAAAVAVVVGNFAFGWSDWIASGKLSQAIAEALVHDAALACVLYVALTVVGSVVLAVPAFVFSLAAGALFGPVWGTVLCWLSLWAGACGAFIASRYLLKDAVKPRLKGNETLDRLLFSGARESDVFLLAVTRLVPIIPFSVQNFAYGVTDIGFAPYALYTALFLLPGTAAFTFGAAAVVNPEDRVLCVVVAAVLFALSLLAAWALKRKAGI